MTTPPFEDPNLPQRLRAQTFIREGEQRVARTWFRSLTRFLDRVRPAVTAQGVDPGRVSDSRDFWTDQVDVEVLPVVSGILTDAWRRVTAAGNPPTDPWVSEYLNQAGNRMSNTPDEVYGLIVARVERGITDGDSLDRVQADIRTILTASGTPYWRNRAMTVARTETIGAVNAGVFRSAELDAEARGDVAPAKVWISTEDKRTRPTHVLADKQRTLLRSPFVVGGAQLLFPGDPRGPAAEVINCHPGDVRVSVPSGAVRIYRRAYEGAMIRIQMADGVELSATPNHPLLTDAGWKRAEDLKAGDHLCGAFRGPGVGTGEPDVEDVPATFHELYRAALESGAPVRVAGRAVDFHGDGSNGEVEVVLPYGVLRMEGDTRAGQGCGNEPLIGLCDGQSALPLMSGCESCNGSADWTEQGFGVLAGSGVGSSGQRLPLLRGGVGLPDEHGFATPPNAETEFGEASDDDRPTDAEVVRKALDGLPGGMALREIVKVNRYSFAGHVYNLQAVDGWYIANGTASGNCRCSLLPVILGEEVDWTDRQNARRRSNA